MAAEDLVDVLNTMLGVGYVEAASAKEKVTVEDYAADTFEINPAYASDLRDVLRRS